MSVHTTPDSYTKLLIHSDTSDASTTFVDSSANGHTITPNSTAQHKTAQKKFGATSMYFDGNSDYLDIASHADWNFGTGQWTIDFWYYTTSWSSDAEGLLAFGTAHGTVMWLCNSRTSPTTDLDICFDGTGYNSGWTPTLNTWYHLAFVREGTGTNETNFYVDGVQTWQGTDSQTWTAEDLYIGCGGNRYLDGYLDEFRVSKGIARWTDDFVPPNNPYDKVDSGFVTNVRQLSQGEWTLSEGGEIHQRSNKVIHAFKSSGIFHIPRPITCDIVVVGGGAAGSIDHGGGGGAGAIGYKTSYSLAAGRYAVTVGAGGVAGTGNHGTGNQSSTYARMYALSAPGGASSFGSLIVAYGGQGAQGCCSTATLGGGSFGCGGGALRCNSVTTTNKGTTTISATFAAYMSTAGTDADYGGGGGGAGAVGANSSAGTGGNGARPVTWADAWGTDTNNDAGGGYFAGGGGGGSHNNNSVTDDVHGGYGGGGGYGDDGFGNLESSDQFTGPAGLANTGGGGAGVGNPYPNSATSGAGGSGIVLIKYDT